MIVTKIELENFQCYYDIKTFEFTKGLNIVMAANSHGKSKLFDAITWLFTGVVLQDNVRFKLENLISKKALELNNFFNVSALIECEKDGSLYSIKRFFEVESNNGKITISKEQCEGRVENLASGERNISDGKELIEELFPSTLRKYSLFKGERSLNVFDPRTNKDALKNLVNALSNFRNLDAYVNVTEEAFNQNERLLDKKAKKSQKDQKKYDRETKNRDKARFDIKKFESQIEALESERYKINKLMEDNISSIELGPKFEKLKNKIRELNKELESKQTDLRIKEDYIINLFDEKWLLLHMLPIQEAFDKKITSLQRRKRKLTKEHDMKLGEQKGKKDLIAELTKSDAPLPIGAPSQAHMEEMLSEELCKVCNRKAPKGSEAYEFMQMRLNEFIKQYGPVADEGEEDELPAAFKNEFIDELTDFNKDIKKKVKDISKIEDEIRFNNTQVQRLTADIKNLRFKVDEKEKDKEILLSNTQLDEDGLADAAINIRNYQIELPRIEKRINETKGKIEDFKKELISCEKEIQKINIQDLTSSENIKHSILKDLKRIAKEVKEKKFNEFLSDLEVSANQFYTSFGVASNGYTGIIRIRKGDLNDSIKIQTVDHNSDVDITHSLSSSTQTAVNLSILMAISALSTKKQGDSLPMIFDAPISEFDHSKSIEFFNLSKDNFEQSIVLMKNYVIKDGDNYTIDPNFKDINADTAYWVKLDDSIDHTVLNTVESKIVKL